MFYSPLDIPVLSLEPFTDHLRWRSAVGEDGRHSKCTSEQASGAKKTAEILVKICKDGGWVMGTVDRVWSHIATRILGIWAVDHPVAAGARGCLHRLGLSDMGHGRPALPPTLLSGLDRGIVSAKSTSVLHPATFDGFNVILSQQKKCTIPPLRHAVLDRVYEPSKIGDENTDDQGIGLVNEIMNLVNETAGVGKIHKELSCIIISFEVIR
ncbi:hypothetical protein BDM02DRAFT_3130310 [Thelephora ganbajun]|uniref:Uncharacterized protein n=1 Tax=Thelephora ganbajun TaxID=370292 RepID=A0ACB6Z9X3_THEGA|nr:hypothetical protein BDM02DRAFT_3130310 [Thelephora ganbajun]